VTSQAIASQDWQDFGLEIDWFVSLDLLDFQTGPEGVSAKQNGR
jgi:hypothetical protein